MKALSTNDKKTPAAPVRKAAIQRKPLDSRRADAQRAEIRSILDGVPVQAKLKIGAPDDAYEREADAVADRVVAGEPSPPISRITSPVAEAQPQAADNEELLQAKSDDELDLEDEELLQPKLIQRQVDDDEELLQPKKAPGTAGAAGPKVESGISALRGGGNPLSSAERSFFEPRLGADLSGVRVHDGPQAHEAASSISARAFTLGNDIAFAKGEYSPGTEGGNRLIAHELTHVMQQKKISETLIQGEYTTETTKQTPEQVQSSLAPYPARAPYEIVIMSGGPTSNLKDPDHDNNSWNYATAAKIRMQRMIASAFGNQKLMTPKDRLTWVVMRPPYRYRDLEDGKAPDHSTKHFKENTLTQRQGEWNRHRKTWLEQHPGEDIPTGEDAIRLHFIDSSEQFVQFINEGAGGERGQWKIGRFEYFGHGVPGLLWFTMGWEHVTSKSASFSTDDISKLDPGAFVSEGEYRSWSCNTATPPKVGQDSFVQAWVERMGGRFVGAVGRTTYVFVTTPKEKVFLSKEIYELPYGGTTFAYWTTTESTGTVPSSVPTVTPKTKPPVIPPIMVHESELPADDTTPAVVPEQTETNLPATIPSLEPEEQVCHAEVVPLDTSATPGDLVLDQEGAGRLNFLGCGMEEEPPLTYCPAEYDYEKMVCEGPPSGFFGEFDEDYAALPEGYYLVHEVNLGQDAACAPDLSDPSWYPFLQSIADRAYHETLDTDSAPGTGFFLVNMAREVNAHNKGFYIGVVKRNGKVYYKIFGSSGAHSGIPGRWYPASDVATSNPALAQVVNPRVAFRSGLKSGSVGIGGALTVAGTTLDYAIDPKKEFGTDYVVDLGFDLAKSSASAAAGSAAGAAVTGWLAGGAMGASIGSAAPVIGTIIGFVVGVLAAIAIEYFIEDYRASIKAYLHGKYEIGKGERSSGGGGGGVPGGAGGGSPGDMK